MRVLRAFVSMLAVGAASSSALLVGSAAGVAAAFTSTAGASENRPFTSGDVFDQSKSLARGAGQWSNIQKWLDKPAPRLEVDPFQAMSDEFPAKRWNEYRGQILVLDFWGTWCGPCLRGMPKMSEFAKKYKDKGVAVLGVCNQNRGETMVEKAKGSGMLFPTAFDREDKARAAFGVQWWPYYVIVDRDGIVRAAGVSPAEVEDVVDGILRYQPTPPASTTTPATPANAPRPDDARPATPTDAPAATSINPEWLEGTERQRLRLAGLEGQPAPAFAVDQWMNVEEPLDAEKLRGKVVLVSFWATWCRHCQTAAPVLNELHEKYGPQGLVILGVCAQRGVEQMGSSVEQLGMKFPVAADPLGRTTRDYRVDGYPDYYLIDHAGVLRAADVKNGHIEDAIKVLLGEANRK